MYMSCTLVLGGGGARYLMVELRSDSHVQFHVELVVVGDEGSSHSAAGNQVHHGRLNLPTQPPVNLKHLPSMCQHARPPTSNISPQCANMLARQPQTSPLNVPTRPAANLKHLPSMCQNARPPTSNISPQCANTPARQPQTSPLNVPTRPPANLKHLPSMCQHARPPTSNISPAPASLSPPHRMALTALICSKTHHTNKPRCVKL